MFLTYLGSIKLKQIFFLLDQVGNESLRSISSLEKLEELAMVCCSCIDDDGLELLGKGSNSLQVITV